MKAILVINVPDDFLADPSNAYRLQIGGDAKVYYVRQGEKRGSIIGDTRDIKPMPEEKERELWEGTYKNFYLYRTGWNDCINAIIGGTKGEK